MTYRLSDKRRPGVGKPYTVGTHFGGSTSGGPYNVGNPGAAGNASVSMREYWQRSYGGQFAADYDAGLVIGADDLAAEGFDGFNALRAVLSEKRDLHWQAKIDGYREATISRGPIEFGPALTDRNDEC
jgi:hypothetical protein